MNCTDISRIIWVMWWIMLVIQKKRWKDHAQFSGFPVLMFYTQVLHFSHTSLASKSLSHCWAKPKSLEVLFARFHQATPNSHLLGSSINYPFQAKPSNADPAIWWSSQVIINLLEHTGCLIKMLHVWNIYILTCIQTMAQMLVNFHKKNSIHGAYGLDITMIFRSFGIFRRIVLNDFQSWLY